MMNPANKALVLNLILLLSSCRPCNPLPQQDWPDPSIDYVQVCHMAGPNQGGPGWYPALDDGICFSDNCRMVEPIGTHPLPKVLCCPGPDSDLSDASTTVPAELQDASQDSQ